MDTIVAISTPYGTGGIAVIRLSGPDAFVIANKAWRGVNLTEAVSHTAHFGEITDDGGEVLDQAVATLFRTPKSFTGEDTVEFSVHGSKWIQRKVVERLTRLGARPAEPGEFTKRAFLKGRLDLAQAEAVADVISASSRAAHRLAISQMSGSFSNKLRMLRERLIDLASLLELELDFSEEEVEFADRTKLLSLTDELLDYMRRLASTYAAGKAFKEGVPVVIAGSPNAGKSTLLNALLGDDKAIVSDVPGTTRDIIEDTAEINGILFRFIDTAGLRQTSDKVEKIGISRAQEAISRAMVVIWIIDGAAEQDDIQRQIKEAEAYASGHPGQKHILALNKSDIASIKAEEAGEKMLLMSAKGGEGMLSISAKEGEGIDRLEAELTALVTSEHNPEEEMIVTNARHYEALRRGSESLGRVRGGLEAGLSADFISQDIREAIYALGTLTGEITADTLLTTIFSRFCIGK